MKLKWSKQGLLHGDHWSQLPVADNTSDTYVRIYYSRRLENKSYPMYIDLDKNNLSRIVGRSEEPILPLGELGTFDQAGVMPTELIEHDGKKYLYYIGWSNRTDVPYFNTIGLAVSEDNGNTFRKYSTGPVFGCSHKEPGYTGTISIRKEGSLWRGWYLSCREWEEVDNRIEPLYDIKYATSLNGIDWEPTNKVCIPRDKNTGGISQASVFKIGDVYHMLFSHRGRQDYRSDPSSSYRIGSATSVDGIDWEIDNRVVVDISEKSEGERVMVEYPYVVKIDGNYWLFYNGDGFGKTGIFYAKGELR